MTRLSEWLVPYIGIAAILCAATWLIFHIPEGNRIKRIHDIATDAVCKSICPRPLEGFYLEYCTSDEDVKEYGSKRVCNYSEIHSYKVPWK